MPSRTTHEEIHATIEETAYAGDAERRLSTREERAAFLRARKLRRELFNWIGRGAIGVAVMFGCFWVGRVETNITAAQHAQETLAVLVKTVADLAIASKDGADRERSTLERQNKERTEVLLELKEVNSQISLLRAESQARVVSGARREP